MNMFIKITNGNQRVSIGQELHKTAAPHLARKPNGVPDRNPADRRPQERIAPSRQHTIRVGPKHHSASSRQLVIPYRHHPEAPQRLRCCRLALTPPRNDKKGPASMAGP